MQIWVRDHARLLLATFAIMVAAGVLSVWRPWHAPLTPPQELALRVDVETCRGSGVASAFAISADWLVTNRHVVEEATMLRVEDWSGVPVSTGSVLFHSRLDVGLIRLMGDTHHTLKLAQADPIPGDWVYSVGYPEGGEVRAARGRVVDYIDGTHYGEPSELIRASADVEPGSSGGPLLNEQNEVVGLVFAIEMDSGHTIALPLSELNTALSNIGGMLEPAVACG